MKIPPTFSVSSGTFPYCFDSIFSIKQSRTANKLKKNYTKWNYFLLHHVLEISFKKGLFNYI